MCFPTFCEENEFLKDLLKLMQLYFYHVVKTKIVDIVVK